MAAPSLWPGKPRDTLHPLGAAPISKGKPEGGHVEIKDKTAQYWSAPRHNDFDERLAVFLICDFEPGERLDGGEKIIFERERDQLKRTVYPAFSDAIDFHVKSEGYRYKAQELSYSRKQIEEY
ncbi:hypothetical protein [Methylomagnum ishizawai]|uniref:hypothetical protein n=1 Tax=Methylomagnum ishizawai TaxID=1760988 RepID=UPI000F73BF75|nr:hypothetical protein [Methylomagnum ishizawai]